MIMEAFLDAHLQQVSPVSWRMAVVSLLTAFVLCQFIAAVYVWTFRGLSYSRSFVLALSLTGLVATLLMLAIGDNVARGLGMLGALAVIRFRSTLRDVRDMTFIFASLAVGIAVGVQSIMIGIIGAVVFCLFSTHLTLSNFATRRQFDGLLRLNAAADPLFDDQLKRSLRQHCSSFVLVNIREVAQGSRLEQSYQVKLRQPSYREHLVNSILAMGRCEDVSLLMQDPSVEN